MENLFFILLLVSFFLLILGLFSPMTSLFWTKPNQTRGKSSLIYGIATIIFFVVYGETATNKENELKNASELITSKADNSKKENSTIVTDIALGFINGYVENSNIADKIDWVNASTLTTENFKAEFKKILNEAYDKGPEVRLDFDPILDAQDNPDKGFELETFDEKTNYLTVRGKDWPAFKLTMKIIKENGNWLVDGCGIINIPIGVRSER